MKKAYKILLIREDNFGLREFNLGAKHLYLFLSGIVFLAFSILVLFSDTYANWAFKNKLNSIRKDNQELQNIIESQEEKMQILYKHLDLIKDQGEVFRKLVKLPPINDEIRKLGIGGSQVKDHSSHLEYLLPKQTDLESMHRKLNHLNRLLNLESMSYSESYNKVEENDKLYLAIPAIHPVDRKQSRLSSRYGYRRDPITKKYTFHDGDDFSARTGTDVFATADGIVKRSRYWGTYGNYIEVDHGFGYRTIYGHLSNRKVNSGDRIIRGQKIGEVGNTGKSTAPHLHYEIKKNGKNVNPKEFYFDIPTTSIN